MYSKRGPKPVDKSAIRAWKNQKDFASRGTLTQLANALGIAPAAVSKWPYVPRDRLAATAAFFGVEPKDLRPDLFDPWSKLKGNI